MDKKVKEIINYSASQTIHQSEMAYVVEKYIKEKKGKDVKIAIIGNNHPLAAQLPPIMFAQAVVAPEAEKLGIAFEIARGYFESKQNEEVD